MLATISFLFALPAVAPADATCDHHDEHHGHDSHQHGDHECGCAKSTELTLGRALTQGEAGVTFRYRVETVDEDSRSEDAFASTLRTTVHYTTQPWRGWSFHVEAEDVTAVVDDDEYNNAGRGSFANNQNFAYPVVADPQGTELNQAYLRWAGDRATVTVGRQEINLGDQRFVGAVGWRQNHQSFDAVRVQVTAGDRVAVDYGFIENVNRIFGDNLDSEHHLLTVPISWSAGRLTAYGYRLDFLDAPANSTLTLGLEYTGSLDGGPVTWSWEAEFANQTDTAGSPRDLDADYLHGRVGAAFAAGKVAVAVDFESLGHGGQGAFQTPLATLHKFNGFADRFLTTPGSGLETSSLQISGKAGGLHWMVAYLDHDAEVVDADLGTEIDGLLTWKAPWADRFGDQSFGLKLAFYDADLFATDTDKIMFWTACRFGK